MPHVLIINGSIRGAVGNTAFYLRQTASLLADRAETLILNLAESDIQEAVRLTCEADAVIFGTGTYWDNWGSPFQEYLEFLADLEGADRLVGKPAGVVVTMDSAGGEGLLFRLQGVLLSLGFLVPPFSGLVLSRVGAIAVEAELPEGFDPPDDVWRSSDLSVVVDNVLLAMERGRLPWVVWDMAEVFDPAWPK